MKLLDLAQCPAPSVRVDTPAWKAVEVLRRSRSGALVVVADGDCLAGVLSERDLVYRVVGEGRDPRQTPVGDVMTRDPITTGSETTLDAALERMTASRVRHLVVVDADRRPLGLLSLRVVAQAQMEQAAETIAILQDYTNDSLGG